ncbi:MAG: S-formylglutathione hydrolase [Rhodospirillaceae bacterium]|nr:S-formylglutathione hydrolase [Rhodospirillaceae bacterium]
MTIETLSRHACFGGTVGFYRHEATTTRCTMRFAVFTPPQAARGKVPVLTYLAGLTCTEETFMIKAGAQRLAAELGLMLVAPDTSPRGEGVARAPGGSWDFGLGAGFYLDATEPPYAANYRMYSYITQELPALIAAHFPADMNRQGIFGHSMGGHGALTIALKNPNAYRTVSAFAPIVAPMQVPWGQKAFAGYLGSDRDTWRDYDATELVKAKDAAYRGRRILIDQGLADQFLDRELKSELFANACHGAGIDLKLRQHEGYDHGYYFISTFIDDHLRWHADGLRK